MLFLLQDGDRQRLSAEGKRSVQVFHVQVDFVADDRSTGVSGDCDAIARHADDTSQWNHGRIHRDDHRIDRKVDACGGKVG